MREGMAADSHAQQPLIDLPGINESELLALLRAVYASNSTNNNNNNNNNNTYTATSVAPLLAAASYLSMGAVREASTSFLQRNLSLETVAETLNLAEKYDCASLRCDAFRFLQAHLSPLLLSEECAETLQLLAFPMLRELLASDELEVLKEVDVAQSAAIWIFGDISERLHHVRELLSCARAVLSPHECTAAVHSAAVPLLSHHPRRPSTTAIAAVQEAFTAAAAEIDNAQRRNGTGIVSSRPREGSPTELMVVGGVGEGWRTLKTVEMYNPRQNEWCTGPFVAPPCSSAAACTLGNRAYFIEGSAHLPTFQTFDRKMKTWEALPRPPHARVNMAVAALPSVGVLVLGGRAGMGRAGMSLGSVDRFDHATSVWQEVSPMRSARASLAACSLEEGQKIVALGGQSDRSTHDSAEWYEGETGQWITIAERMNCPRKYLGAAGVGGQILAIGGMTAARQRLDSVEGYDFREGRWRSLPSLSVSRSSFGVAVLHGEVFVVGGLVGEGETHDGVECLSLTAGKWRECATLGAGRSGLAVTAV